jgi:hypothetical protein
MDGPTVSVDASGKQHVASKIALLCLCIVALILGLIDLSAGYHRLVPTCSSAGFACYYANKLWPHRWWEIVAVAFFIAAIASFFVGK